MTLFHNNSFFKPKRSHFDEKKILLCSYSFSSVFAGTVLSVCFKCLFPVDEKKRYICVVKFSIQFSRELSYQSVLSAFSPSIFSLIAVEINLKNECQIYLSHQQLRSCATLSLLRFNSTAIELKLDGKCALI